MAVFSFMAESGRKTAAVYILVLSVPKFESFESSAIILGG